ncbi:FAD-dependent monooxygenase family protein [Legionella hackeliae]|uniref:Uncharacterized protein n=1 Tax=Legionella hackeliae TaxID=449 RepID=A0A0A8ULU7_LEGHA|nr:hypothetical protein [Legionella hackeliae]KTD10203.1 hypothetical protein Lhac_2571 [Legionella hackeliae]CEK09698.1 conserved protein of unknown function [Legionella hackeliae]STX49608.1 ubiquinone biosynthesis hydroxylase, UbiH/UbiF/VisC/COQ6 family [Legionella hackeliae]
MTDVVIVGGGPIGLAYAWGMKKLNPNLDIVVLEKYSEYQRKHTLVMQYKQLQALMDATETAEDNTLKNLVMRLKADPHIRTNELETIFKTLATEAKVKIVTEEVKKETIQEQIFDKYPNARLVIGADGTHSTVSETLFPPNNQIKHEFDYVLQLRYEVEGERKTNSLSTTTFYQEMARQGLIANEYVGSFADGKTPVTMQMMISKEAFEQLKAKATSKNPILPFNQPDQEGTVIPEQPIDDLPGEISTFVYRYLHHKIRECKDGEKIAYQSIRVSVNEAPATHAAQLVHTKIDDGERSTALVLGGDASLGLSYFKGLNAGLESTAYFFEHLKPVIKNGLPDAKAITSALANYQSWFLETFAPSKIQEVKDYSTYRIRKVWNGFKIFRDIKNASTIDIGDGDTQKEIIADYFKLLARDTKAASDSSVAWRPYPHRSYEPVKLGQFAYIPIQYTLSRIGKIFIDFFKPYKSEYQLKQDFKQPLVGLNDTFMGLLKIVVGFFTLDFWRFADGIFSVLKGAIELATTPLVWIVKPISRSLISLFSDPIKIEDNKGIRQLAAKGLDYLDRGKDSELSPHKLHELLAICNDLDRKYNKCLTRGQTSDITQSVEKDLFYKAKKTSVDNISRKEIRNYFSLFQQKPAQEQTNKDVSTSLELKQ